ncbi:MAG: ribbon-helix-helix domain-containing protein [Sphingobacteriales bacterium]
MKSVVIKRSIILDGHKTSVSLENEFWEGLREIVSAKKMTVSDLVGQIDRERDNCNLSSAIRVFQLFSSARPPLGHRYGPPFGRPFSLIFRKLGRSCALSA